MGEASFVSGRGEFSWAELVCVYCVVLSGVQVPVSGRGEFSWAELVCVCSSSGWSLCAEVVLMWRGRQRATSTRLTFWSRVFSPFSIQFSV